MTHKDDIWNCDQCGTEKGKHDQFFEGVCEDCHIQAENTKKKDEVEKILIGMYSTLGMDIPSNHEDITQFVFEDVCDTADPVNWHSGDVSIGFRRWIEAQAEN